MWSGIVPFLVHWLALSTQLYSGQWPGQGGRTHWSLLSDFQLLPEDEIEEFLPQICSILVEQEQSMAPDEYGVYSQFHKLLIEKCSGCLPFGLRVCSLLKSASHGPPLLPGEAPGSMLLKTVIGAGSGSKSDPAQAAAALVGGGRDDRLRYLRQQAEEATSHGLRLPQRTGYLRAKYFHDLSFMLDTMARLGTDLKAYPPAQRNYYLRSAVSQLNTLLFNRMMAHGRGADEQQQQPPPLYGATAQQVALACPEAAAYSLHLPLQHCREKVQRILQFVQSECEVLPSKDRCPYVLVAEVLELPYTCKSEELFTHTNLQSLQTQQSQQSQPPPQQQQTVSIDEVVGGVNSGPADGVPPPPPPSAPQGEGAQESLSSLSSASRNFIETQPANQPVHSGTLDLRGGQSQWPTSPGDSPAAALPPHLQQQQQQQQQPPHQPQQQQPQQYQQQYQQQYSPPANQFSYPPPQGPGAAYYPQQQYQQLPQRGPTFAVAKTVDEKIAAIRSSSAFGHLPGWSVKSFIVKSGDDLRKELLAMQVIDICQHVFQVEGLDIYLHPYQIISTGPNAGLVEFVEGTISLDRMKKSASMPNRASLKDYFEFTFGGSYTPAHQKAQQNFVKSLAGYSLVTHLLQVRDRHNANLLLDTEGHIVHIDFGFILGDSPGFNMNFENAPFKLTREYVEVLGGLNSPLYKQFEDLFMRGYFALQKHREALSAIVQLFYGSRGSKQADGIRQRLGMRGPQEVASLVSDSFDNSRTTMYDRLQKLQNGIQF